MSQIRQKIIAAIDDTFTKHQQNWQADADWSEIALKDLNGDSITMVELQIELSEIFDMDFPCMEMNSWETLSDLEGFIKNKKSP